MLADFKLKENSSLYEYCKRLTMLYEMEADLWELGYRTNDEISQSIVSEILDVEEKLREKIKKDEL